MNDKSDVEGKDRQDDGKLWNADYVKLNVANFLLFFAFYMLMPLLPIYLSETFGAGKHTIGVVLSGYTVMALLSRSVSGYLVDSFDRRKVLLVCYLAYALFFSSYLFCGSLVFFAIIRTLHGAPFGATTVANSTSAIDALPPSRRTEGIGYYGLSNNVAMALAPSVSIYVYHSTSSFDVLFLCALMASLLGFVANATVHPRYRPPRADKHISLNRFFLVRGWPEGLVVVALSFSYGILSTYLAIYGQEQLGKSSGTGTYFLLLAAGLMFSRLVGSRSLRAGKIVGNASLGMSLSLVGYVVFAAMHNDFGYYGSALVIGLGNGHMFPAMQTMFINLAHHNQRGTANATLLTSWDLGIGLGVIVGGVVTEMFGYLSSFWVASAVNALGVAFFFLFVRRTYMRDKLR